MNLKKANLFRNIARYTLLIIGIMGFLFALFSGAGDYGGGFQGILKNSPNVLPWLILLILTLVAWKRELIEELTKKQLEVEALQHLISGFNRNR